MVGGSRLCSRESNQLVEGRNLGRSKHWPGYSGHILQLETLFEAVLPIGLHPLMRTIYWVFMTVRIDRFAVSTIASFARNCIDSRMKMVCISVD